MANPYLSYDPETGIWRYTYDPAAYTAGQVPTTGGFKYTVYFHPSVGFYYYAPDERGLVKRHLIQNLQPYAGNLPVTPQFHYQQPTAMDGKPSYLWPNLSGSPTALSVHIDAIRWVRATLFLDASGGAVDIPLLDGNNRPLVDPSLPPMAVARAAFSATDYVTAPGTSALKWFDTNVYRFQSSGAGGVTDRVIEWGLIPKPDPVPHWVLRAVSLDNLGSGFDTNLMVDMFAQWYGDHDAASWEVGSPGTSGHYKLEMMWGGQSFNAAGDRVALDDRRFARGALHVNDGAQGTLFLTTGANQGLSTGTSPFATGTDDIPAVVVFGHKTLGTDFSGSAVTTWDIETWGLGVDAAPNAATGREKMYHSSVEKDSGTGKWKAIVSNSFFTPGGPRDATKDRTFIVFAFGRKN